MTTIKVSKNTIIFTYFSLIVLMPAYITDQLSFIKMLSNVTAACMVLFLVKEKNTNYQNLEQWLVFIIYIL